MPTSSSKHTATLESTVVNVDGQWHRNFYYYRGAGRRRYTADQLRGQSVVVSWIDDRNEAARLGVSVEELLEARRVAEALDPPSSKAAQFMQGFQLTVPAPRLHGQIKNFK